MEYFSRPLVVAALMTIATSRSVCAQPASPDIEARAVRTARLVFATTNREQPTYRRVERKVLGLSTEGAAVVGLFRGSELRKIEVTWYGETGKAVEEYYLDGGRLVFCYESQQSYDEPFGRVVRREENRYYFADDGKLVRWIDPDAYHVARSSAEFREAEQSTRRTVGHLLRALALSDSTYEAEPSDSLTSSQGGHQ
jgi:hypothetical protein